MKKILSVIIVTVVLFSALMLPAQAAGVVNVGKNLETLEYGGKTYYKCSSECFMFSDDIEWIEAHSDFMADEGYTDIDAVFDGDYLLNLTVIYPHDYGIVYTYADEAHKNLCDGLSDGEISKYTVPIRGYGEYFDISKEKLKDILSGESKKTVNSLTIAGGEIYDLYSVDEGGNFYCPAGLMYVDDREFYILDYSGNPELTDKAMLSDGIEITIKKIEDASLTDEMWTVMEKTEDELDWTVNTKEMPKIWVKILSGIPFMLLPLLMLILSLVLINKPKGKLNKKVLYITTVSSILTIILFFILAFIL